MSRRRIVLLLTLAVALGGSTAALAQRGRGGGRGGRLQAGPTRPARYAQPDDFDGGFQFCRVVFRQGNGDGAGWNVDWPRADINLSVRAAELSRIPVSMESTDTPKTVLVRLSSPEVFHCPFLMMSEPGGAYLDDAELANLRAYLLKGGFLWADDFWGDFAWDVWESQLRRALPSSTYPIVELPRTHPIFHQAYDATALPQIPGIAYWDGGTRTSERGPETATPHVRGISDAQGRLMVLMTFNTDLGDAYEREAENPAYFQRFSVPGYAFGVNVLLYAMAH